MMKRYGHIRGRNYPQLHYLSVFQHRKPPMLLPIPHPHILWRGKLLYPFIDHVIEYICFFFLFFFFFAVVFSNLDRLLREQHAGNVALSIDNNQYLAKCRGVLSVMRSTRAVSHPIVSFFFWRLILFVWLFKSLEGAEHYFNYNEFCIKVFQSLRDYPALRMAENMSFWVDLGRVND